MLTTVMYHVNKPFGCVSILTRPWGRVQRRVCRVGGRSRSGFNPHPPLGAGATFNFSKSVDGFGVSILTRPWGRVQQRDEIVEQDAMMDVSILTRPWGRVQHAAERHAE